MNKLSFFCSYYFHYNSQNYVSVVKGVWWTCYLSFVFAISLLNSQNYVHEFLFHCHFSAQKHIVPEFIFTLFLMPDFYFSLTYLFHRHSGAQKGLLHGCIIFTLFLILDFYSSFLSFHSFSQNYRQAFVSTNL